MNIEGSIIYAHHKLTLAITSVIRCAIESNLLGIF